MIKIIIVITGRRDARLVGEEVWTVCRSSIRGDRHDYIYSFLPFSLLLAAFKTMIHN